MRFKIAFLSVSAFATVFSGALLAQAKVEQAQVEKDWPQDTVVVAQGDVKVTVGDVDAWMQEVTADKRFGFVQSPERIETMLTQLLLMKQMLREAAASGVDKDPFVVAHSRLAAERVIARYQVDAANKAIKVPDMSLMAQERYQADREKYREPDIADFAHILISEQTHGAAEARALIDKVHRRVVRKPGEFSAIAQAESEDPSAANNAGAMRNAKLAELDVDFAAALRKLKVGEISEPVKSQFGWHVIRLDKFTRGELPTYDDMKAKLILELENEYRQRSIRAYSDGLRQRELQPNVPVLERLAYRYGFTGEEMKLPDSKTSKAPKSAPAEAKSGN